MRIYHDSRNISYRKPFGAAPVGSRIILNADVSECELESVKLELWQDGCGHELIPMEETVSGRFSAEIKAPEEGCLLWYRFAVSFIQSGESHVVYYGNNAAGTGGEGRLGPGEQIGPYQITVYKPAEVPVWYREGIVYQIFPDRFARDEGWRERVTRSNEHINARRSDIRKTIQEDWYQPAYYERDEEGNVTEWPMYGGSLRGIEEKLDYIASLGATAIYLNPVFEATSNHRYDTADYMRIDPALGTDEDFRSLAEEAEKRGIRIILDGVFSHTGCDSIYFDKFGNYSSPADGSAPEAPGAWKSEDSPYRSWYKFDSSEKNGYKSWWGVADLPEVDENDPGYRKYILGEDGVVAHWLRMGASGWRLDVADELPDSFIEETRTRVRETKEDGLLIGEVWEDASNKISYGERRRYFYGDELDAAMNYPIRDILLDFINYTLTSSGAAEMMMSLRENYPPENFYGALNLIGSHDRERIITAMACEEDYPSAVSKVKLLSVLQYALPGVPCVYYGDEAGLKGGPDPANRSGFPWGAENLDLEYHYRMLGVLYDEHHLLCDGEFRMLSGSYGISDDVFAFIRSGRDDGGSEETILVLANRSYGDTYVDLSGIDFLRGGYALELLTSTEMELDEEGSLGGFDMEKLSVKMISIRKSAPKREDLGRRAGVVCHISSLGVPKLGRPARDFVDFLADAGLSVWQVLPLNPAGLGDSPYSSYAAFAGEPGFINRDELPDNSGYEKFIKENLWWLADYIAYSIIRESQDGKPWFEWSDEMKFADSEEFLDGLSKAQKKRAKELAMEQYFFDVQWRELREYANSKGVNIMGDLPMYMAADSADVWANQEIFRMDEFGRQKVHAGVPPDAFSGEGQDWGNPLYDWEVLMNRDFDWWIKRIRQCACRYDILRIDHFRALSEYFAIPEGGGPKDGYWQHGPGLDFIKAIRKMLDDEDFDLKILAEDLGYLDDGVKNLIKLSGLPGMDIWQFNAFDMMKLSYEDPEAAKRRVFYTGTHDNNTLIGFIKESRGSDHEGSAQAEAMDMIRKIYESPACLAMMQIQDVFMLGEEARMNVPGVPEGNWSWKMAGDSVREAYPDADRRAKWLRSLAERTGRC